MPPRVKKSPSSTCCPLLPLWWSRCGSPSSPRVYPPGENPSVCTFWLLFSSPFPVVFPPIVVKISTCVWLIHARVVLSSPHVGQAPLSPSRLLSISWLKSKTIFNSGTKLLIPDTLFHNFLPDHKTSMNRESNIPQSQCDITPTPVSIPYMVLFYFLTSKNVKELTVSLILISGAEIDPNWYLREVQPIGCCLRSVLALNSLFLEYSSWNISNQFYSILLGFVWLLPYNWKRRNNRNRSKLEFISKAHDIGQLFLFRCPKSLYSLLLCYS